VRFRLIFTLLLLAFSVPFGFASLRPNDSGDTRSPGGISQIQHVIIIMQENRTTDNLFHGLKGADTANYGINSKGQKITLTPQALANKYGLDHYHPDFIRMYDGGKMDGADLIPGDCGTHCPPNMQFKYVQLTDVKPYFTMAEQYGFGDRMFQSNQGPSYPAHQFIIAATSAPSDTSPLFDGEDTFGVPSPAAHSGCGALPQVYTILINPVGQENLLRFPCFDHMTLMDLLDNNGLTL
jgi:phospholipase C